MSVCKEVISKEVFGQKHSLRQNEKKKKEGHKFLSFLSAFPLQFKVVVLPVKNYEVFFSNF